VVKPGPVPSELQALMTTQEIADYLRLNERTVLKLAASGELPGVRLGNQWRFRKGVIDAWLDDQALGLRPSLEGTASSEPATFRFEDGFKREHVLTALEGRTMSKVLEELSARAQALDLIRDKTWFLGALIERENVLTSCVGNGIAFPHTLARHPEQVRVPFFLLGRSLAGIDFPAPDAKPVHIVVLMGLKYQHLHLPWLKRLTGLLQREEARRALLDAPSEEAMWCVLRGSLAEG
jgi:excisionase family DNA binding protein